MDGDTSSAATVLPGQYAAFRGALPFRNFSHSSPSARALAHASATAAPPGHTGPDITHTEAQMTSHPNFDRTQAPSMRPGKVTMHPLSTFH
jgi:hypothetical protein